MPSTPTEIAHRVMMNDSPVKDQTPMSWGRELARQGAKLMLQEVREELQTMINGWQGGGHAIVDTQKFLMGLEAELAGVEFTAIDRTSIYVGMRIRAVKQDGTMMEGDVTKIVRGKMDLGNNGVWLLLDGWNFFEVTHARK